MTKKQLINRTLETLSQLPQDKIRQINDFADYIFKKYEEENIQKGAEQVMSNSKTFDFLKDEEDLYSSNDLKEKFK